MCDLCYTIAIAKNGIVQYYVIIGNIVMTLIYDVKYLSRDTHKYT